MILYHGTTTEHIEDILKNGIKPRYDRGIGNWENAPSRRDMVYLTNSYAPFFAHQQCDAEFDNQPVVIEVDVPVKKLYPDEDYLEQFTRIDPAWAETVEKFTMEQRTEWFKNNLLEYKEFGLQSLEQLGNCCFKGIIRPKNIIRYTVLDGPRVLQYSDPTITLINQRLLGERYQKICSELIWSEPFALNVIQVK